MRFLRPTTATDGDVSAERRQPGRRVPWLVRAVGYVAAAWCLGFAAVNGWDLVTGREPDEPFAAYAGGIAVMSLLVLVLKILGAVMALLAIRSQAPRMPPSLLATGLWGAFGVLAVYSTGNIVLAAGNVAGLTEPSDAWESAGGISARAVGYVLFFLIGTVLFGVLAVSFHRRHGMPWRVAVVGLLGAPVLLGLVLVIAPRVLGHLGLLPS